MSEGQSVMATFGFITLVFLSIGTVLTVGWCRAEENWPNLRNTTVGFWIAWVVIFGPFSVRAWIEMVLA